MLNVVENAKKNWRQIIKRKYKVIWLVASLVFLVDFFVKRLLLYNLAGASLEVIKNIFHISVVGNTGAAFGILKDKTYPLIIFSIIFILFFLFFIKTEKSKNSVFYISCGLILGGALSNLYDRIFLGFVIDYIDLRIWPVFNLSDSCITIGISLLLMETYLKNKKHI